MDIMLIAACMFLGSVAGGGIGLANPDASPESIALLLSVGGIVGATQGFLLLAVWGKSFRRPDRAKRIRRTPVAPANRRRSFHARFNQYAGKSEDDNLEVEEFRSSMPFWSAVDLFMRIPPKSAAMIRHSLEAIRRTLRKP